MSKFDGNKFDYDLYKSQVDKISLNEKKKNDLVAMVISSSAENVDKPQNIIKADFYSKKPAKRLLVAVVALAVLVTSTIIFNMNFSKESSLDGFTLSVALENGDEDFVLGESPVTVKTDNDTSVEKGDLRLNPLDFYIKGEDIVSVDVKSKNKNFIICTGGDDENLLTEMTRSSYKGLEYKSFKALGWMPSYENILAFDSHQSKDRSKYLSDQIEIVIYKNDNTRIEKTISITYDENGNYLVKCS